MKTMSLMCLMKSTEEVNKHKNTMNEEIKPDKNLYNASQMKKIIQTAEVSLWLDGYDDIFSDFDPRSYSQRAISDDFLAEMEKVVKDRGHGSYKLKFLLSPEARNLEYEQLIRERLRHFFGVKYHQFSKEKQRIVKRGIIFVSLGIILMFLASFIKTHMHPSDFFYNFLIVLAEPAGWFLFWEGLARAMYKAEEIRPKIDFYNKMARSKISFISY